MTKVLKKYNGSRFLPRNNNFVNKKAGIDIFILTKKGQELENLAEYDHFFSGISKAGGTQQGVSILMRKI